MPRRDGRRSKPGWKKRLSALLIAGTGLTLCGQDKPPASVWDGIYTEDQAARGQMAYAKSCGSCHGEKLEGKGQNPPLAGSDFQANWNGMNVGELLEKMQTSMPADHPGQLSKAQNAAILAYILKFNKFPAGSKDVSENASELRSVRFEAERPAK